MIAETETQRLDLARQSLAGVDVSDVGLALVLGSGLKEFAASLTDAQEIPFHDVANWPVPRVEDHGGSLILGHVGGLRVACLTGRVHLYEGWHPSDVVRPVRTLRRLGIANFVLTNAAGGLVDSMQPGDLMVLTDHLNLTGSSPLIGPHEECFGPLFPDQSAIYDADLRERLIACRPELRRGIYAGLLGPSYETPAEVRMLRSFGADAVGMSTVHEAMALAAMSAKVAGISMISNLAAGMSDAPLDHDDVIAAGAATAATFTQLLRDFCQSLSRPTF